MLLIGVLISYSPRIIIAASSDDDKLLISSEDLIRFEQEVEITKFEKAKREVHFSKKYYAPSKAFDPNHYTKDDWIKLGLSEKQADVVIRFTERGIRSNEELKKIYVIPSDLYELLKDSTIYTIRIVDQEPRIAKMKVLVELNSSSESDLLTIPGIGPYYAKKIIEYRSSLGGFVADKQLLEIWKFDEEKLSEIKPYLVIDDTELVRININSATIDELKSHPYISYSIANSIVKMRLHEPYEEVSDIKRSKLIDDQLFDKLEPYLKVK